VDGKIADRKGYDMIKRFTGLGGILGGGLVEITLNLNEMKIKSI
jgi:hypothetical protein